jgi:hypothetical protein
MSQQKPLADMERTLILNLTSVTQVGASSGRFNSAASPSSDRGASRTIRIIPRRSADAHLEASGKVILVFEAKLLAYLLYFQWTIVLLRKFSKIVHPSTILCIVTCIFICDPSEASNRPSANDPEVARGRFWSFLAALRVR